MDPQVLVVGAGPTGLLLAAELHRRAVRCELVDALDARRRWDRATVIHPRSLELFGSLGLVGRFLDAGVAMHAVRLHSDGRVLGELDLATSGSTYRFNLGLSEETTEEILTDYLHRKGGSVTRGSRLVHLARHDDAVTATIEHDGHRRDVTVPWLVGCDGFHSPTRTLSGIAFDGHDIPEAWAVFDATLDGWPAAYDMTFAYLDTPTVIITALPGRRWRVYLRPSSHTVELVDDAAHVLGRYAPEASIVDVANPTRFECHTRVARPYRAGRVLVAGDAAHVCSPAEGHGMNSGLQDAANLAWKLGLVCQGVARPELLDSYEAERRPVALRIGRSGDAAEASEAVTDPAERATRDATTRAALHDPVSGHGAVLAETELDVDYAGSPIVTGDRDRSPGPGDHLPGAVAVRPWDAPPGRLAELTHRPGHTLLVIGGPDATAEEVAATGRELSAASAASAVFDGVVTLSTHDGPQDHVGRIDPAAAESLGVRGITVIGVRPDQYVGFRRDHPDAAMIHRYAALLSASGGMA